MKKKQIEQRNIRNKTLYFAGGRYFKTWSAFNEFNKLRNKLDK